MRFGVLGPLVVWDGEGREIKVPEAKVRALLADLLAHDGAPVSADRLIDDLWGDAPPGRPAGALQAKVSQLRRVLGRERVLRQPPGYRLRLDGGDEVDAARFHSLLTRAHGVGDPRARAALLTEALELWRGPAYADFADESFVRGPAQRLTEHRLSALEAQAEARLEAGEQTLLAGELADPVARYPLRERLRALQMRALYAAGRQSEALASYADLRTRLADELGVDPSPELAALHGAILRQDTRLSAGTGTSGAAGTAGAAGAAEVAEAQGAAGAAGPAGTVRPSEGAGATEVARTSGAGGALNSAGARADTGVTEGAGSAGADRAARAVQEPNAADAEVVGAAPAIGPAAPSPLPASLTPLIGRRDALARLSLALGGSRLVTLTGPGGVGKTRLAVAAAAAERDGAARSGRPADSVWLVEFSGIGAGTAADLAQVVATTLGIRDDGPTPLPGTGSATPSLPHRLAAVLRDRRTLLVLDNCEHVVDAAAELAELLLRTAPGLRVLATGQEPLGLPGETVFLVEPLSPDDAVRLFMERAASAAPGFPRSLDALDEPGRQAVAEICRRLDGIPLALELAATRVRALGVRELAARLHDRFRVLTFGRRGAPARQQTLRAMIDWSWELLGAPERIVLRRLAAHRDGCDLEAAEAVCAGDGVGREEIPDLVTRLVDRSLVVVVDGPAGPRYRLLESVAAYAAERLQETEDLTAVRDRHLRHYRNLAERAEPRLRGAGQRSWLARLDAEAGNLRAALDEAVRRAEAGEPGDAVRLATALAWWWLLRGRLTEARRSLGSIPAASPGVPGYAELGLLRSAFALLTGDRGTVDATAPTGGRFAVDGEAVPDTVRRARALWLCAYGLFSAGDAGAAEELNDHALALFTAARDEWGTAATLGLRATLALVRGDLAGLGRDGSRSARIFHELGDQWGELQTVSPLAALAEIKGAYAEAERRQHEGLRMARELGLEAEVSARLSGLGRLALLAGAWDRARDLHEQARRIAVEQGYKYGEIHAEMGLALGARRSGDLDGAEARLLRIRDGHAEVSSRAGDHLLLAELGFVAELRADAHAAAAHHEEGLRIARVLAEPRALALSLEGLAGAAALSRTATGASGAALLLGAAAAARGRAGAPLPPAERADVDRITAAARTTLGASAFTEAYARGTTLSPDQAVLHARPGDSRRSDEITPRPCVS
ncbi:BTAD domain-containing putative transcriptional regulator [Streptomyces sp. NPDC046716]|uniref:AfsR/SARP family transcriptional regulator n=1 Tax=Streptomyces sp. NPDC046716 TaxID=3157093 RepID=UPI0033EC4254